MSTFDELSKLSVELKSLSDKINEFTFSAIEQSGLACAREYVHNNKLEYIEDEILSAFREGFRIGVYKQKNGLLEKSKE